MDPNVKKITRVGYRWMLFGLGLLAVGLFFLIGCLALPLPPAGCTTGTLAIVGGVMALLGATFMSVRFGVIVDRQRRTITTWWGLLVPIHKTEHPFSQSHHVILSREERSAGRSSYEVFPVRLEGASTDAITIHEPRDYDKARRLGEEVAKFLHLEIRDRSSGEEVAREAGALDKSLRQRVKRSGLTTRMPQQPPGAKASVSFGGKRADVTIDIPPIAHWLWFALAGLLIAALSAVFIEFDSKLTKDLPNIGHLSFTFLVLLCLTLPAMLFIAYRMGAVHHERLTVSSSELVLTRRSLFGTNTTRLKADEIEEVEITRDSKSKIGGSAAGRVVIRSDRGSVELGAMRSEEELRWLRDMLINVLTQ
jgi:hypothetical protein